MHKKRKARENIQTEIKKLNTKRKAFISEKTKYNLNGLENAMITALKTQAKKKNYTWE